jgi:hypothetical protein
VVANDERQQCRKRPLLRLRGAGALKRRQRIVARLHAADACARERHARLPLALQVEVHKVQLVLRQVAAPHVAFAADVLAGQQRVRTFGIVLRHIAVCQLCAAAHQARAQRQHAGGCVLRSVFAPVQYAASRALCMP